MKEWTREGWSAPGAMEDTFRSGKWREMEGNMDFCTVCSPSSELTIQGYWERTRETVKTRLPAKFAEI